LLCEIRFGALALSGKIYHGFTDQASEIRADHAASHPRFRGDVHLGEPGVGPAPDQLPPGGLEGLLEELILAPVDLQLAEDRLLVHVLVYDELSTELRIHLFGLHVDLGRRLELDRIENTLLLEFADILGFQSPLVPELVYEELSPGERVDLAVPGPLRLDDEVPGNLGRVLPFLTHHRLVRPHQELVGLLLARSQPIGSPGGGNSAHLVGVVPLDPDQTDRILDQDQIALELNRCGHVGHHLVAILDLQSAFRDPCLAVETRGLGSSANPHMSLKAPRRLVDPRGELEVFEAPVLRIHEKVHFASRELPFEGIENQSQREAAGELGGLSLLGEEKPVQCHGPIRELSLDPNCVRLEGQDYRLAAGGVDTASLPDEVPHLSLQVQSRIGGGSRDLKIPTHDAGHPFPLGEQEPPERQVHVEGVGVQIQLDRVGGRRLALDDGHRLLIDRPGKHDLPEEKNASPMHDGFQTIDAEGAFGDREGHAGAVEMSSRPIDLP
jgi:hypothetical protein